MRLLVCLVLARPSLESSSPQHTCNQSVVYAYALVHQRDRTSGGATTLLLMMKQVCAMHPSNFVLQMVQVCNSCACRTNCDTRRLGRLFCNLLYRFSVGTVTATSIRWSGCGGTPNSWRSVGVPSRLTTRTWLVSPSCGLPPSPEF